MVNSGLTFRLHPQRTLPPTPACSNLALFSICAFPELLCVVVRLLFTVFLYIPIPSILDKAPVFPSFAFHCLDVLRFYLLVTPLHRTRDPQALSANSASGSSGINVSGVQKLSRGVRAYSNWNYSGTRSADPTVSISYGARRGMMVHSCFFFRGGGFLTDVSSCCCCWADS